MAHSDDPLWDGAGCGPTSSCCQLNNPPWFCVSFPEPTTDDLELRICTDQSLRCGHFSCGFLLNFDKQINFKDNNKENSVSCSYL